MIKDFKITVVAGSRTKTKAELDRVREAVRWVFKSIDSRSNVILSGGCPTGADRAARELCDVAGYRYIEAPCFWHYGKSSGIYRNMTMSLVGDRLVAFWDGKSAGTASIIDLFNKAGKPLWIVTI